MLRWSGYLLIADNVKNNGLKFKEDMMAVIKTLLTSLVVVALTVSTASAVEDINSKNHTKVMSKEYTLAIKPMAELQKPEEKRVFNSVVLSESKAVNPAVLNQLPPVVHNEIYSEECYTRFGKPPVVYVLGVPMSIDCNYYLIDE